MASRDAAEAFVLAEGRGASGHTFSRSRDSAKQIEKIRVRSSRTCAASMPAAVLRISKRRYRGLLPEIPFAQSCNVT